MLDNKHAANRLLYLFNECWNQKTIPNSWHKANVVSIFKKGDSALLKKYRPISLLQVTYKLFASILLQRLKNAGAEQRLWPSQFGFRSGYGTNDGLFMLRRLIDKAAASKNDKLIVVALDWAKAFDAICPRALCDALKRFGICDHMIDIISMIYSERIFNVRNPFR